MKDNLSSAVENYEGLCQKYFILKEKANKNAEDTNEYNNIKRALKEDIPDAVYMNSLKRIKSDKIFYKSLRRLTEKSLKLFKLNRLNDFGPYLEFIISIFDNTIFEFLSEETKKYFCMCLVKLIKIGDNPRLEVLNKLLHNIECFLMSCSNKYLTCITFLREIVLSFNNNHIGMSVINADKINTIRIKFQENDLIKIFTIVINNLENYCNNHASNITQKQNTLEKLLELLLIIIRTDFTGKTSDELLLCSKELGKCSITEYFQSFRPPKAWKTIVFKLNVLQLLFRILKFHCNNYYIELLVFTSITHYSTLQIEFDGDTKMAEEFIQCFSIRISEIIEKYGKKLKSNSILHIIIMIKKFNSTSIFREKIEARYLKLFSLFAFKSSLSKFFSIISKRAMESNYSEKLLLKAVLIFMKLMQDFLCIASQFYKIKANGSLEGIFLFIEEIYEEFLKSVMIQPIGYQFVGTGSILLIKTMSELHNKSEKDEFNKYFDLIMDTTRNQFFIDVFHKSVIKVVQSLHNFTMMNENFISDECFKQNSFIDMLQNINILLRFFSKFFCLSQNQNYYNRNGYYFINTTKNYKGSKELVENILLDILNEKYNLSIDGMLTNHSHMEPYCASLISLFLIGQCFIKLLTNKTIINIISVVIDRYLKCLCKMSKISDQFILFDCELLSDSSLSNKVQSYTSINEHKSKSIKIIISQCFQCLDIYKQTDINKTIHCVKIIKNTFSCNKNFLMSDSEFILKIHRDLFNYIHDVRENNDFNFLHILSDVVGLIFFTSIYISNPLQREYCYRKLGQVLRIQESFDAFQIINYKQLKKESHPHAKMIAGVIGIIKHFPKDIYYRQYYKKLIEFFINPIINVIPLIWKYTSFYSDFIHQYALFCIELLNLYLIFPHFAIEFCDFSKMIKVTTYQFRYPIKGELSQISMHEFSNQKYIQKSNFTLMMSLGMQLVKYIIGMNYHADLLLSNKIHSRLYKSVVNIIHGVIQNTSIKYLYNNNLMCSLVNLVIQFMAISQNKIDISIQNLYLYGYVTIHGLFSFPDNQEEYVKAILSILKIFRLNKEGVSYHYFELMVGKIFYYMYNSILNKIDDRMTTYILFQLILEMMVNYYKTIRIELEAILKKTNLLNKDINDIIQTTDSFYHSLSFNIAENIRNLKIFELFLQWLTLLRKNYVYLVVIPPT